MNPDKPTTASPGCAATCPIPRPTRKDDPNSLPRRLPGVALGLVVAAMVAGQSPAQFLTMNLAGPAEGLNNSGRNIYPSHNQHVVENANGIFCALNGVKLARSTNGGQTFNNVYNRGLDMDVYRAPTIETDEDNNIYLIYPEPDHNRTRFQKFTSANGYTSPTISVTHSQASSASKFASVYDQGRAQLYHGTQGGYLFTFDKSGNFVRGRQVWTTGSTGAAPSYPHLFVDESGVLHFGQTTVSTDGRYDSIRYLKSTDGGQNWRKMDGTAVTTPVSCDANSTNSTRINLVDEEGAGKNTWLANMHVKNGMVHFMHRARGVSPERQHYMRFNASTGVREIDSWTDFPNGAWKGETLTINSLWGCFASDPTNPNGPLFAVSAVAANRAGALVSYDNGATWQDYGRSANVDLVGDFGSSRFSPQYGRVIGMFSSALAPYGWATPLFFQFPTYNAVTWDSTSSTGWGTAASWLGDMTPTFDNKVDVHFYADGATSLENNLGPVNRTVRSLQFNGNADSSFTIYLAGNNPESDPARVLSFNTDGNGAAGSSAEINIRSGATGSFTIGATKGSVTLANNLLVTHDGSGTLTIARPINETGGAKSLTKTGTGEMALAGANTFTGGITINQGKLAFATVNSEDNQPDVNVAGGTLSLGADFVDRTATIGNLSGAGNVDPVWGSTAGTRTIRINQTSIGTFAGNFMNGSGGRVLAVRKIGDARLTLSGTASTHSGGTQIFQGMLRISGDGSLGASGGDLTFDSGGSGILMNNDSTVTLNSGRQVNLTGDARFQAGWTKNLSVDGKLTGAGALRIVADANPGFVIVSNPANDYSGITEVQAGSRLRLGASNVLPDTTSIHTAGTLDLNGRTDTVRSLQISSGATFAGTGTLTLSNAGGWGINLTANAGNMTIPWNIVLGSQASATNNLDFGCQTAGDTLTLNGAVSSPDGYGLEIWPATSTIVFGHSNTYPGLTSIFGTLRLGVNNAIKPGNNVSLSSGTLDLNGNTQTLDQLTGNGSVLLGNGTLTLGSGGSSFTCHAAISGAGALTKAGAGTLTLAGTNTYSGGTTLNAGVLFMGSATCLPGGRDIIVGSGTTFGTAGYSVNIGTGKIYLDGGNFYDGNSGSGCTVTAAEIILLANSEISPARAGFVIDSVISGSFGLIQNRSGGTLQLNKACTYTGGTTITAGTMKLNVANAIPGNSIAGDVSVAGTLDLNSFSQTINGLNGTGTVDTVAGGTPTLTVGANGNNGLFSGVIRNSAGTLALAKAGAGRQTLTGTNTYSGGTTIHAGTLRVSINASLGAATGTITFPGGGSGILMNNDSTVTLNSGRQVNLTGDARFQAGWTKNLSVDGKLTGAGALRIVGDASPGFVIVSNPANDYSGITEVQADAKLQLGASNVLPDTSSIHIYGTLDLNGRGDTVRSLQLSSGATFAGTGTLTLSNAGGWGINLTANAGNMTIPWNIVLGSQVSATNNLDFGCQTAGNTLTLNGVISSPAGYGFDIWPATSTIVFGNPNTYPGLTHIFGTLRLGVNNAINPGNNVLLSNGTLDVNGRTQSLDKLEGAGNITLGNGALTLGSGGSSFTCPAIIGGNGSLTKSGTGTLALTASNSHTGPTTVATGTLLVNAPGSLAAGSSVTVATAATLGGSGAVNGSVSVNGTLAPGNSAGTLTAGAVSFQPGSTYQWELANWTGTTPGTHWDWLAAASLAFNNTASNKLTVRVLGPFANFSEAGKTFAIATTTGAITGFDPANIAIDATGFPGTGTWSIQQNAGTIELKYTVNDYAAWAAAFPGFTDTDPAHDPDGDGLDNFTEYAFGLDPTKGTGASPATAPDRATGTFTYTRRKPSLTGLSHAYQFSTTLSGSWATVVPVLADQVAAGPGPDNQTVTVNLTGASGNPLANPALFLRVAAVGP